MFCGVLCFFWMFCGSPGCAAVLLEVLHLLWFLASGDAHRQINELKFKLVKSEQEVTMLEQSVCSVVLFAPIGVWCMLPFTVHVLVSIPTGDSSGVSGDTLQDGGRKCRED